MWVGEPAPIQTSRVQERVCSSRTVVDRRRAGTARPRRARIRSPRRPRARGRPAPIRRPTAAATFASSARRSPGTSASTDAPSQTKTTDFSDLVERAADRPRGLLGGRRPLGELLDRRLDRGGAQLARDPLDRLGPHATLATRRRRAARRPRRRRPTATPRSISAPSSVSASSTAASAAAMSKMSNQPMWPIRKTVGLSAPCPGARVTPWRSRRWRSSCGRLDSLGRPDRGDDRRASRRRARRARAPSP